MKVNVANKNMDTKLHVGDVVVFKGNGYHYLVVEVRETNRPRMYRLMLLESCSVLEEEYSSLDDLAVGYRINDNLSATVYKHMDVSLNVK